MSRAKLIISPRKGEALVNVENDSFERIMIVFHSNRLNQISRTLHFGIKPGHLMVYAKLRGEQEGRWILRDAGYINYFRADYEARRLTEFNTLARQKLFSKGWLSVHNSETELKLVSQSVLPLHRRTVTLPYHETAATLTIEDRYLGWRTTHWNLPEGLESQKAAFRQERQIDLLDECARRPGRPPLS